MSLLDELRAAYPDNEKLKALSDPELVSLYSQATGASLDLSAMDLGLDPNDYIQNTGRGQDLVNQGILGLGDIVSGVAGAIDIPIAAATDSAPFSKAVDWAADATGLSDYAKRLDVTMSPQSQETRTAWDKTWNDEEMGAWDKAKNFAGVLWDDPAYALEFAARSAPTLVPAIGGAKLLGMGAKAMEAAGLTRTAAAVRPLIPGMAEGGVAAGYQMNNLLEEDVGPREAAGYSALTGAGTGLIGGVMGALGARAGLTDPHRRLAGYRLPDEAPALPWYQRIPGGIAMEAGQEALQSPWEQAMTNVATDQPWDQGLARSAVEGAIGGGIIGAPFNIFRGREIDLTQTPDDTGNDQLDPTKGLDTSRVNAPSVGAGIRNLAGLNTAEGLSNWAGVRGPSDTAGYAGDLAASYNEPSGHRVADKVTGVERELSTGDWLYYQATGQLPPTTDPVKVEGKPKPVEGVTPEMQRLLDVARNLPMAADPAKVKPGEVSANGHRASGRPTKDAVNWATTLSGLKTEDEVNKAVEKGTRSKAGYWQWVMPMAAARIQEIKAEQAKTTAQQAKQNATVDGPGVSVTPTIAQNAQPTEGVVPPTPTTSSVAQDEVDEEFAREMPPITPEQHARAKANGIRSTSDLDIAHRTGELDVPTPPPSPTTPETPTNALSGQTTPQAGQETGTTAPDATTEPGVEPEVAVPDYKTLVWGPVVSSTDVKDANGQVNIKSVQVSEDGAWELHRVRTRPQNGRSKNVSIQVVPNPNPPAPTVAAAPMPVPVPPAQPAAPTGPSPVVEKAVTGAPLTNWELDDVVLELGQDILTNELADRVNGWVKPVPKLTKSAERDPQKVAAHNEAVARREQRLDQLRKTVLEVVRNRLALGPYDGAEPDSYDTLASAFILRDTDGRPVLDENNNPVSLPDMRKGTKYGVWTQTQVKALDDLLRLALVRRGVNLNTVDRVEARDVDPDAAIQEVQYDNQTLGASGGVRFQDDALDVSGEGADAAKGVRDLSSLGDVGRQAFSNDVPPGAAAPKAPATEGETEAKPVNIWEGEVDLGTDATHSNIGGADTGAGRKVSGASLMHWARRAGYDVEADPPAAKAKAAADLKELHPLARQSWVDAVNQHAPSTRNEELDATNAAMLDALYRSVSEYQPNERRIGRVDISLRRDMDTIAKTKFAEGLYNLHRAKVPDAPDYTGLLPTEVALFTEATRSTVGPGLNRDAFLRNAIGLIVAGRKQSAQSLLRAGEPATAAGDASRDAGAAADNGQASLRARAGVGETESGAAVESGGQAEPDIVIGARDATGIAVKKRGRLSKEALAAGRESTQSDAATVKRAVRAAGTKAEPQVQQGLGEDVAATNPTTEQTLRDTIASLLGKGHNWRIHVYATPEEAHAAGHPPRKVGNAYGWVEADQKGVKHAYFIVNRIEQGTELGKFLHEVGAHIGLENILSPALYQNLVGQLRKWAALNNDSLESRLAKAALARVESAQAESTRAGREGLDQAGQDSELIAYFLEEAVKAGVDPTATKANSPLGTWFMRLWTAFKRALGKLNIDNLDALTPQDVVDLAYGAARLSLVERKNAAPQRVTEAMPTQYGVDVPSHITSAKEAVHNALSDTYTGASRGLLGWMGINNIAERFGDKLPVLKSIEKTFNEMSHQAKLWLDRGDQIERMWSMLTPKQTELVSFIAGNATILQFDPSKDQANTPEKQEIAQKWKELQALDAANPKAKGTTTLLAAVQHYQDVHKESLTYLDDVLKQAQAAGASTHAIESVRDTVKALKKKQTHFWLPLHRFGDFHSVAMSPTLFALHQRHQQHLDDVRANKANPAAWSKDDDKLFRKLRKDPKHYEAMGHESERAARRRATHWQGKGWHATSNINRYTSDQARAHLKPEIEAFEKMLAHTKLDAKVANKLIDSYTDLLIEALPENHILKRQLDREGIAGWDPDMKRAFAKTAQSQAFAMSRLLHARKLGEQLGQLERQGDSFQPHATLARDLHAELIKQQELAMTRSEDPYWVRFATGFNYMSMLGGSPFFWALQLAQVPTITLPYLIGRNNANVTDTMGKLATAWGQAKDFVKWSVEANEWRAELDFSRAVKGVTPEETQALKEMDEAGRFVFTIGQDLGAAAEGRNTKTARFIRSINAPTHTTELINRVSTGLAAYRISRKNGSAPKAAVEFALRTIDNTQVNMDPVMGARNLKTLFGRQGTQPFAKIIFQFWKFQQGMAYTTLTTMKDAWTHPDPALRKQARDSAIGLTISLMTTSGIFGLPFVGTGMMLLSFLAGLDGDDDEDDNVERLVKNWIAEAPVPKIVADTLNKGFLSSILPTNYAPHMAPRFSLGTLMNPLGYARFDDAERGEDVVKELMFRVLGGPTGSSAAAFWDGIQAGLDGEYAKATEKIVPLKLMRDLARAYTLANKGVSTGNGETRIDPNDMSVMSWIWQAMGVTPMKKAMYHEGQAGVQALKMAVTGEREKLLARHAQARLKGEDVSEVTRDILRFNQKHPYARIKAENLRQAFGRRRDNRRKLTDTGILADKQNQPYLGNAAWTR